MLNLLKDKKVVIPLYLYRLRSKMNLSLDEFFLLMYLYNDGELILFNLNKISEELAMKTDDLMIMINGLMDKGIIDLKVIPNDKNIMEEYLSLDNFYNRVSLLLMNENKEKNDELKNSGKDDVFTMIEQEFGRTLSPMEYEYIQNWLDNNYRVEIIACALKEAVLAGVSNLRYIDKILYEWNKKGLRTKDDVEKYMYKKRAEKESPKIDSFDDDWLN